MRPWRLQSQETQVEKEPSDEEIMDAFPHLVRAIAVIVILYALALLMRRRGALNEDHSLVLTRIVVDLFLPAIVFATLAGQTIRPQELAPALVMLGLELGAIVFCAAFGSSTFLGYALIVV